MECLGSIERYMTGVLDKTRRRRGYPIQLEASWAGVGAVSHNERPSKQIAIAIVNRKSPVLESAIYVAAEVEVQIESLSHRVALLFTREPRRVEDGVKLKSKRGP